MSLISNITKYIIIFFFLLVILVLIIGGIAYYLLKVRKITSREEQFDYSRFDRRDSVEFIRFNQIINAVVRGNPTQDGIIVYEDGNRFVAGVKVIGFNFFTASAQEQFGSMTAMISFLNTVEKDVQYRQSTKAIDLGDNIKEIKEKMEALTAEVYALNEERENMLEVLDSFRYDPKTFERLSQELTYTERTIKCKSHSIDELEQMARYMGVISDHNCETEKIQCWFLEWAYDSNEYTDELTEEEKYEKAAEALTTKFLSFSNALSPTGCTCERMSAEELMDVFRLHYAPDTADVYKISDLYDSSYNTLFVTSNVLEELEENIEREREYSEWKEQYEEMKREAQQNIRQEYETYGANLSEEEKLVSFAGIEDEEENDVVGPYGYDYAAYPDRDYYDGVGTYPPDNGTILPVTGYEDNGEGLSFDEFYDDGQLGFEDNA